MKLHLPAEASAHPFLTDCVLQCRQSANYDLLIQAQTAGLDAATLNAARDLAIPIAVALITARYCQCDSLRRTSQDPSALASDWHILCRAHDKSLLELAGHTADCVQQRACVA